MNLSCSIVIPIKDEAENILPLIAETQGVCEEIPGLLYEIIVVDDGSTDASRTLLAQALRTNPRLRVIYHRMNAGQSAAVVSGVRVAQYPWIFTLDGDGQNPPHDLVIFLDKLISVGDKKPHEVFFIGHRMMRNDGFLRKLSTKIAYIVRNWMLNDGCLDAGCATKLFARDAFLRLPRFDHMHRFLGCLFKYQGAEIVNIPVSHRPRTSGVSKYTINNRLWVGIRDLFGVRWLLARKRAWANPLLTETGDNYE
ncbi:MAG: glycosyltransferase family 2 protein [Alphaproteobacteria bacterium]|nr:MAG: glycosyltransferase family 2 protein [Alphaproteobacteria bacterium]